MFGEARTNCNLKSSVNGSRESSLRSSQIVVAFLLVAHQDAKRIAFKDLTFQFLFVVVAPKAEAAIFGSLRGKECSRAY